MLATSCCWTPTCQAASRRNSCTRWWKTGPPCCWAACSALKWRPWTQRSSRPCAEQELQRQLLGIGLVRRHSAKPDAAHWHRSGLHAVAAQTGAPQARPVVAADSDFDPTFDSRIDAQQLAAATLLTEQTALLAQVQRGLGDPGTPALAASYGPDAHLHFNFSTGPARQHRPAGPAAPARAPRTCRRPAAGVRAWPTPHIVRELHDVLWDAGPGQRPPGTRWPTPRPTGGTPRCAARPQARIERYSRVPQSPGRWRAAWPPAR
jgi:hypothetical protein